MPGLTSFQRRLWRASLSADSLLTRHEVCLALPGRPLDNRAWVDTLPPFGLVGDRPVYRWCDIIISLKTKTSDPAWISTDEAATLLGVSRSTLDAMVAQAPRTLPGSPVRVGDGGERRHLRWDPTALTTWMNAYRDWRATRGRRSTTPSPKEPTRTGTRPSLLTLATARGSDP